MSKDQAARIAERARETVNDGEPVWSRETIAKDIRRAIRTAVRKERERCVKCVWHKSETSGSRKIREIDRQSVCEDIIKAINGGKNGKA